MKYVPQAREAPVKLGNTPCVRRGKRSAQGLVREKRGKTTVYYLRDL